MKSTLHNLKYRRNGYRHSTAQPRFSRPARFDILSPPPSTLPHPFPEFKNKTKRVCSPPRLFNHSILITTSATFSLAFLLISGFQMRKTSLKLATPQSPGILRFKRSFLSRRADLAPQFWCHAVFFFRGVPGPTGFRCQTAPEGSRVVKRICAKSSCVLVS